MCVCVCAHFPGGWQWCLKWWRPTGTPLRNTGGKTCSELSSGSLTTWSCLSNRPRYTTSLSSSASVSHSVCLTPTRPVGLNVSPISEYCVYAAELRCSLCSHSVCVAPSESRVDDHHLQPCTLRHLWCLHPILWVPQWCPAGWHPGSALLVCAARWAHDSSFYLTPYFHTSSLSFPGFLQCLGLNQDRYWH